MNSTFQFSRLQLGIICSLLVTIPFLLTAFPPITDLPQQIGQIRLFWEAVSDTSDHYAIQWLSPYNLCYVLLGSCVYLFGYEYGGRIAMMLIAVLWCVAIHFLAAQRNRPPEYSVLAGILIFNHILYWGLYNFALGFPIFIVWFLLTLDEPPEVFNFKIFLQWSISILLLYFAHVFWFLAALCWFAIVSSKKLSYKSVFLRSLSFVPALLFFVFWSSDVVFGMHSSSMLWDSGIWDRIKYAVTMVIPLGGIKNPPVEKFALLLILGWIGAALVFNQKEEAPKYDLWLLLVSLMFMLVWFAVPDFYDVSIRLWMRWLPPMVILFVLAMPPLRVRALWRQIAALLVLGCFIFITSSVWIQFEREELAGLREALNSLPARTRVIGLDYLKTSPRISFRPYMQLFSYAYLFKDASLNFSFADLKRGLVINRSLNLRKWQPMLEWYPERATDADLKYFDYAIVGADKQAHRAIADSGLMSPATSHGQWRLYKIINPLPQNSDFGKGDKSDVQFSP